jgi:hypothetical protein
VAQNVINFNTYLPGVVAQFDSMVQIADIDSVMNRSPALFCYDGIHANELGASRIATAVYQAFQRCLPTSPYGANANLQPPGPMITPLSRPYLTGRWYTSDSMGGANGTAYTPVIGDMWALPLFVTSGTAQWIQWCMEMVTASAAATVYLAVFDDRQMSGYPQWMHAQPANNGTPLALGAAAGVFTSTTTAGNNGYLSQAIDPGLYWLVVKFITIGTCTIRTCKGPSLWVPNLTATGAGGTTPCGWYLSGQGTAVFQNRFPTGAVPSDNVPMIGVLAQLPQ